VTAGLAYGLPTEKDRTAQAGSSYCAENAMQPSAGKLKLQFAVKARPRYRSLVPAAILKNLSSTGDSRSVAGRERIAHGKIMAGRIASRLWDVVRWLFLRSRSLIDLAAFESIC
jgi:hypothetical protein